VGSEGTGGAGLGEEGGGGEVGEGVMSRFLFFLSFFTFIKFPLFFFCFHNHWFEKGMRGAEEATT